MTNQVQPEMMTPAAGTNHRADFGSTQITRSAETAVSAAAAQAEAHVKGMYAMALQRPRDMMQVREKLLVECQRRGFAEGAEYTLPRAGKKIKGPSVRFAEAAARALTNLHVRTAILFDDAEKRVGEVTVVDLEANLPLSSGFTIEKSVERRKVNKGDVVLGERVNSQGETVYRILGTEADVQQKQESAVARIRRNLILQVLPGDIKDEALEVCRQTLRRQDAEDPAKTAKKLADAFSAIGISVSKLQDYLGHPVDQVTPDEAADLRGIYTALASQEATWGEIMETKRTQNGMSADEKAERAACIRAVVEFRLLDKDLYETILAECGVQGGQQPQALPLETLRNLREAIVATREYEEREETPDATDADASEADADADADADTGGEEASQS